MEVKPRSNTHIYLHNKTNQKQNKCPSPNLWLLKRQGSVLSHTFLFFLFFSTLAQWDLCSRFSGPFWRLSCVFCFLNCWDISSVSCLLHSLRSDPPSAPQSAEGQRGGFSLPISSKGCFFLSFLKRNNNKNKQIQLPLLQIPRKFLFPEFSLINLLNIPAGNRPNGFSIIAVRCTGKRLGAGVGVEIFTSLL